MARASTPRPWLDQDGTQLIGPPGDLSRAHNVARQVGTEYRARACKRHQLGRTLAAIVGFALLAVLLALAHLIH